MSKEILKSLIDLIDDNDIETIFRVLVRFVSEDEPQLDEIQAIAYAKQDTSPTISHQEINWE